MPRRTRSKKTKSSPLIEQCRDLRGQLNRCISEHRDAVNTAHREIEKNAESLIDHLQSRLTEAQEAESSWEEKSLALTEQQELLQNLQDEIDQQRVVAAEEAKEIAEKQQTLAEQLSQSSESFSETLRQLKDEEAKLTEQRKDVQSSNDELRERQSEVEAAENEVTTRREALDAEASRLEEERQRLEQKSAKTNAQRRNIARQLLARRAELIRNGEMPEESDARVAALQRELAVAREAIESAKLASDSSGATEQLQSQLHDAGDQIAQLQTELASVQSEKESYESQYAEICEQLETMRQEIAENASSNDSSAQLDELTNQLDEQRAARELTEEELDSVAQELERVQNELARVREQESTGDTEMRDAISQMRVELDASQAEVEELRMQNQDLASQVASNQVQGDLSVESMSWEQRKQHILNQLDAEDGETTSPEESKQRLEMRDIVERTDQELANKEQEIAELRRLLEEQSGAVGDVTIGGAAIIEMLEQDELIAEERAKLQKIQSEWEEKLRQAEIDVSLERAKLARERIELEQKYAEMVEVNNAKEEPESKGRKWLAQLGISADD